MHKLMILFRRRGDTLNMEERWSQEFVPLADRMPGLRRIALSRIKERLDGLVDLHMVHELYFDDLPALRRAMASPEGQAAGRALMAFASGRVDLYFAEHREDEWPLRTDSASGGDHSEDSEGN
jgi:uncharacterized protein (TIGR02118 family)